MDCNTKQRQSGCPSCSGQKSHHGRTSFPDIPLGPPPMTWPDMPMMEPAPDMCPMRGKRGSVMPPDLPRDDSGFKMRPDMMRRSPVQPGCSDMVRPTMPQVCPDMVRPSKPSVCPDMVRPPVFPEIPKVMPDGRDTDKCMRRLPSNESELRELFPVAMAYVPWQQWQELYSIEQGFDRGTIFPDLDLPFLMGRCW